MGLTRFYARWFDGCASVASEAAGTVSAPEICYLTEQESQHCAKVLRMRAGDVIEVTDGEGALYRAVLQQVDVKCCEARIETVLAMADAASGGRPRVRIVMAPTKQTDRMEWFLEKATEMGTDCFGFVRTHRTERDKLPADRMEKILVSAMKQSLQRYKPRLEPLCTWRAFMEAERAAGAPAGAGVALDAEACRAAGRPDSGPLKCIAYCGEQYPRVELAALLRQAQDRLKAGGLTVLIGPEGDFTPEEVAEAVQAGYVPVLLGPNRLRAETAALYAACAAQLAWL
ncbi:MAG: 16S rRNA (uracil(1498)-N(3))-methyltransferase [Bacteroidales bacterium]|nr:16S rRNA (uracil(1498)-N(3))-methyltransferase [Bacteroidales bacterium]